VASDITMILLSEGSYPSRPCNVRRQKQPECRLVDRTLFCGTDGPFKLSSSSRAEVKLLASVKEPANGYRTAYTSYATSARSGKARPRRYAPLCPPKWLVTFAFNVRRRDTNIEKLAAGETCQLTARPAAPAPPFDDLAKARPNALNGTTGAVSPRRCMMLCDDAHLDPPWH
jgi:hypothetical protein